MVKGFVAYCKDFMKSALNEEMELMTVKPYDMAYYLGKVHRKREHLDSDVYMSGWWETIKDFYTWESENMGKTTNPLDNLEGYFNRMVMIGMDRILDRLEGDYDNKGCECILLDENVINDLCKEIDKIPDNCRIFVD